MTQRCITFLSALLLPFLINAQGLKTDSPKKEKKIVPVFRVMKPIPNIVWATALSGIESGSDYRKKYGDIKSIDVYKRQVHHRLSLPEPHQSGR